MLRQGDAIEIQLGTRNGVFTHGKINMEIKIKKKTSELQYVVLYHCNEIEVSIVPPHS